jgi:hypothetical protein
MYDIGDLVRARNGSSGVEYMGVIEAFASYGMVHVRGHNVLSVFFAHEIIAVVIKRYNILLKP